MDCPDCSDRLFRSADRIAAASTERSTRCWITSCGEAAAETQVLFATLTHHRCITFWSTVASIHWQHTADFDAHYHINQQLRSCYPRVRFQLEILEQEV